MIPEETSGSQMDAIAQRMAPTAAESTRHRDLDGLRGIAALLVIFLHYVCRSRLFPNLGPPRIAHLLDSSWAGVDVFFVLSGFLIGGIILEQRAAGNFFRVFYLRRALRILPLALLTLAFSYLLLPLLDPTITWDAQVPPYAYLLFINNFWTAHGYRPYAPLGPFWSLAIEEQFYLFAPVLLRFLGAGARTVLLIGLIVISPLLRATDFHVSPWDFTLFRLDGLAIGVLIAVLLRHPGCRDHCRRQGRAINAVAIGLVAGALLFASCPQWSDGQRMAWGVSLNSLATGACILSLQVTPGSWLSAALSQSWLVQIGRYSYFLYLMHMPMLVYTETGFAGPYNRCWALIAFGVTLIGAWASWRFIEAPLIAKGRAYSYTTA